GDAAGLDALRHAGAVEALSEHPSARAVAAAAREASAPSDAQGTEPRVGADGVGGGSLQALDFRSAPGGGGAAVGRTAHAWAAAGAVVVGGGGRARAGRGLGDPVKPTSAEAVRELRGLGLRPYLLTGDGEGAAREAARAVGIAEQDVVARVLPDQKVDVVARL